MDHATCFADRHHYNADPDPAFRFNVDPAFNLNVDPDAAPHQNDANLRPLVYRS